MTPTPRIGQLKATALLSTALGGLLCALIVASWLPSGPWVTLSGGAWVPSERSALFDGPGALRQKVPRPEGAEDAVALPDRTLVAVGSSIWVRAAGQTSGDQAKWQVVDVELAHTLRAIAMVPAGQAWAVGDSGALFALPEGRALVSGEGPDLTDLRVDPEGPRFFARRAEQKGGWMAWVAGLLCVAGLLVVWWLGLRPWFQAWRVERVWAPPKASLDNELEWRVELELLEDSSGGELDIRLLAEAVTISTREVVYAVGETVAAGAGVKGARLLLDGRFVTHVDVRDLELSLEVTARVAGGRRVFRKRFRA
jgi:hypothetical protein